MAAFSPTTVPPAATAAAFACATLAPCSTSTTYRVVVAAPVADRGALGVAPALGTSVATSPARHARPRAGVSVLRMENPFDETDVEVHPRLTGHPSGVAHNTTPLTAGQRRPQRRP